MEINKYDTFVDIDEVIEATGLFLPGGEYVDGKQVMFDVYRIVEPRPGMKKNQITLYKKETLKETGFMRRFKQAYPHPLIREISEELKVYPKLCEELIELFAVVFSGATDEKKKEIFKLIQKHIPVEQLATMETFNEG
jgi:hypothetical protein